MKSLVYFITAGICLMCFGLFAQPAYVFFERAEEAYNNQSWAASLKNLDECLVKDPKHHRAFALRAEVKFALGKPEEALKDLNQSLQLNPKNESALLLRAKILTNKKDFKNAEADMQKALELNPKNAEAFYQKGILNQQLNNLAEAEKDFVKAADNNCKNSDNYYRLFLIKKNKNADLKELINLLDKAISLKGDFGVYYFERGNVLKSLGKDAEAVTDFNLAESKGYKEYELFNKRYVSLLSLNKKEETLNDLNKLINEFKSKEAAHYITRSQLLIEKGDLVNASKDLNKALVLDKDNSEIYLARAKLSIAQKKNSTVLPDLNKAIELGIKNPEAFAYRAALFMNQKKFNEALADYTSAIKIKEEANYYYERSKCYYELKNEKAACNDVKKAAELGHLQAKKDINYVCK